MRTEVTLEDRVSRLERRHEERAKDEILKLEIGKLELSPGDILGVKILDGPVSMEMYDAVKRSIDEFLPDRIKALVYSDEIELGIIRKT